MLTLDELIAKGNDRKRLPEPETCRWLRKRGKLTQLEVAAFVNTNRATVSRWESGERTPRGAQLARYLELLDRLAA